ncbi:protein kinase domain-containing protein [Salinimonas sediminis]|nr:tetratricopeptide repeat protein [Salinimonas sediminis]
MLSPGTLLANRFTIVSRLGKGAQAYVYQAFDELLDTTVAIKFLSGAAAAPLNMQTLRNEVLISRSLQHPNIIRVHDVYCDGPDAFFTMTYIPGELLAQRLSIGVSAALYRRWEAQLTQAVMACQSAGILHGDIKPDNLLVTENEDLLLIDFGIGRSLHSAGQSSGHPRYSAPEVIATGIPHPQSDTFSAGRVLQDILQAVSPPHHSAAHRFWRWRTRRRVNQLCAVQPARRPALSRWADNTPSTLPPSRLWAIPTSLALLICLALWLALRTTTPPDKHAATTRQVALIHADGYPLLRTVAKLLRYPLALHPDVALIDAQHTEALITNMALNPLARAQDRVDVASTLGADLVITLELTPANTGLYLIHATATAMPGNEDIFTLSHEVATTTLASGLQSFADNLTRTLFTKLDTPVTLPEIRFAESLTGSDEVLALPAHSPQGLLLRAQQAADIGDIVAARNVLAALLKQPGLHQYWALKANLLKAQIDDNLPLAEQSIGVLIRAFPNRPELLVAQAKVNIWANQPQAAMQNYQQALTLRPNDGYLWFALARLQIMQGDITEALDHTLTRALVTFRRVNDKSGESLILNAFGIGHLRLAEYDEAMRYFTDALALRQPESQPDERAKTLANVAIVASIKGQFSLAEQSLQEALTLVESQHNAPEQAHILDTLGFLHEEQGLYTQALVYYQRGLDLRLDEADTSLQAESMSNVAYMHFLTGDIALAQIYWQQALSLFSQNNDMSHQLRTRQHLVQLGLIKGDIAVV